MEDLLVHVCIYVCLNVVILKKQQLYLLIVIHVSPPRWQMI